MSKDIKCRVWSDDMWLDGGDALLHVSDKDSTDIVLKAGHPLKDYAICLSTGLHDKNGKEIYEGDILKYNDYMWNFKADQIHIGVVRWQDWNGAFDCERRMIDGKEVKPEHGLPGIQFKYQAEVVGNIYENPELLNKVRS